MRVVALLAIYNEERFVANCIESLASQGVEAYVIDNSSTDETVRIAERYLGRGVVGIESLPREGCFKLEEQLRRKEELAASLDADWFMHVDADEVRLPPRSGRTLAEALAEVDAAGYNAVDFMEYTFVPTREAPDHDHPRYLETMRWYYPFRPFSPHRVNAWKRQERRVDLVWKGGHHVRFDGQRVYPELFRMRHYLFLGVAHAVRKYVDRGFDRREVQAGWHEGRASLSADRIVLPSESELREYVSDDMLDPSEPRAVHVHVEALEAASERRAARSRENWPIVVGGCHRSGTSLVRRVLDAHPRIHCGPEVKFFQDFHGAYLNDPIGHARFMSTARSVLPERELLELLGRAFVTLHERAAARAGKQRWADKNPDNVLYLGDWAALLGERWVFVHVVRNPLDTLASVKEARFPFTIPEGLGARVEFYLRHLEAGLAFGEAQPDRYYRLSYEEVVRDPEQTLARLHAWLGERFDPGQLAFNERPHEEGLEDPKVRETEGVHDRSVGRCRRLLTREEAAEIVRSCAAAWRRVDPRDELWDPSPEADGAPSEPARDAAQRGEAWGERIAAARQDLASVVPPGERVILVDENQWGDAARDPARPCVPFLERGGHYWGPPTDAAAAVRELERMRAEGATFVAVGWPAFWWLYYFRDFAEHLRASYPCVLDNDRLVVFDLRG